MRCLLAQMAAKLAISTISANFYNVPQDRGNYARCAQLRSLMLGQLCGQLRG
jgi:hypothetical protein